MMGSFPEMEYRVRRALALPETGWTVEPSGAVQGDQCSEMAVYRDHGGYCVVSMQRLTEDFEGTIGGLRKAWFPHPTEREE